MEFNFSNREIEILRELAKQVREIANSPQNAEKEKLWYAHNALTPIRPIVMTSPEGAWEELLPDSVLQCENQVARWWEWDLRSRIYQATQLQDDTVIDSFFNIGWVVETGVLGMQDKKIYGENRGSYTWEAPLKNLETDLEKLRRRTVLPDREETFRRVNYAKEVFGDILQVRIHGSFWWTLGMTCEVIRLMGLEEFMVAMYDEPEKLHELMAWMRDEHMNFITTLEREGLLTHNNRNDYVGSGGFGFTRELPKQGKEEQPALLCDMWGFAESQETVGVSPEMFGEFIFPYQLPLLQKFGLNCYGCCEPVDKRLKYILQIPNLRRVSVSPWADQQVLAEALGKTCIFSRKPNPAQVCVSFDEQAIRADLRETLQAAGKGVLEIIMKDTHTVQNRPERLIDWTRIAKEEVLRYMG